MTRENAARDPDGAHGSSAAIALVRRYFEEIFNRQDLEVCDEILADDYLEHAPAPFSQDEPGPVHGGRATRETARWLLAQFPDLRFTVEAVIADGDIVAVRLFGTGTNLGPDRAHPSHRTALSRPGRATGSGWAMAASPSIGRPGTT